MRSIRATLSRWLAWQTLIGLSLVCTAVYATTVWSFHLRQDDELKRHLEVVRHLTRELVPPLNRTLLRHKLNDYFHAHSDAAIVLTLGTEVLYSSQVQPDGDEWVTQYLRAGELTAAGEPLALTMSLNISGDQILISRLGWTLLASAIIGSLLVSATATQLVRRGLRPLQRLADETAATGPGQLGRRIEAAAYAPELQPWIEQFNKLLSRVESAYAQLEAFNADVAHELRTPLSNMIAQLEVELCRTRTMEDLEAALESQLEEARRLTAIVSDMLFLSRADRGAMARRAEPLSLAQQVRLVAEYQEAWLEEAGLSLEIVGDAQLEMDAALVRRAVSNLVSNAQRYARPNSVVRVEIARLNSEVSLAVENEGDPVDIEALPRLFERFFRVEASRTGSAQHHGLGLAIVAAIARMHGGTTFAESRAGRTRIGLTLSDIRSTT